MPRAGSQQRSKRRMGRVQAGGTFLQQDPLEQRVLVPEHETLVGGIAVTVLEVLQRLLVVLDGALELFDVLGAALAEGSLGLAIALLALFRGGVYLTTLG
jgi:hypothetical protein